MQRPLLPLSVRGDWHLLSHVDAAGLVDPRPADLLGQTLGAVRATQNPTSARSAATPSGRCPSPIGHSSTARRARPGQAAGRS